MKEPTTTDPLVAGVDVLVRAEAITTEVRGPQHPFDCPCDQCWEDSIADLEFLDGFNDGE